MTSTLARFIHGFTGPVSLQSGSFTHPQASQDASSRVAMCRIASQTGHSGSSSGGSIGGSGMRVSPVDVLGLLIVHAPSGLSGLVGIKSERKVPATP